MIRERLDERRERVERVEVLEHEERVRIFSSTDCPDAHVRKPCTNPSGDASGAPGTGSANHVLGTRHGADEVIAHQVFEK